MQNGNCRRTSSPPDEALNFCDTLQSRAGRKPPLIVMSEGIDNAETPARRRPQQSASRSIFDVPTPIKQLFDRFPLITYSTNDLPQRAPRQRNIPVLHIFTTDGGALKGLPSYNPACLKWQVRTIPMISCQAWLISPKGVPQILQHQLPCCDLEQPCIAEWSTAVPPSCPA